MHAIRDCSCVEQVWRAFGILVEDRLWAVVKGADWLQQVWDLDVELIEMVVTIAWLLWFERNAVVHGKSSWFAGGIIDRAEYLLHEFKAANATMQQEGSAQIQNWQPPPIGKFKINFDASWKKKDKGVGVGVVIRDHSGDFFAGMSKRGLEVNSAEMAELLAAREAIKFALEAGFRDVLLEGDSISDERGWLA